MVSKPLFFGEKAVRTFITVSCIVVTFLAVLGYGAHHESKKNEGTIRYAIPPIHIYSYGGQGEGQHAITTLKTSDCDPNRVIEALNKVGIPATYTTTHAERQCIDVQGEHPFLDMKINGNSVTIVPNKKMAGKYPHYQLEKLATEIRWMH